MKPIRFITSSACFPDLLISDADRQKFPRVGSYKVPLVQARRLEGNLFKPDSVGKISSAGTLLFVYQIRKMRRLGKMVCMGSEKKFKYF